MTVEKTIVLVLDCAEHQALAEFYARLLDAQLRVGADPDFIEVIGHSGVHLAIRRDHGFAPPSWPRPDDSQQAHIHVLVAQRDMDEAEREAVDLGARPLDTKDNTGPRDVRIYSDPAGHPFSLIAREGRTSVQALRPEAPRARRLSEKA
ncbi:VOC family protein [Streptomyces sp. 8N706]|uniref:VOC family protein n=1 Tax=Streptomyces sp. 8N706 TaxID=3457416 RepID=UPI003FD0F140